MTATVAAVTPWPCAVCGREWRGFAVKTPREKYPQHFCSFRCSEVFMLAARHQIDITKDETAAALTGGKAAGAYLDEIGKSDLTDMTQEEWEKFCATLFTEACADLARQAEQTVPF